MINRGLTAALLALALCMSAQAGNVILPEISTPIQLSNRDVNRFVCPGGKVEDIIYSKEKGIIGHYSGNSAFIKFKIQDAGGQRSYATKPQEIFFNCNGDVYTVIATPKNIPSKTMQLSSGKGDTLKKNIAKFKNMPLEKRALHIIREAYDGTYPSSYRVTKKKKTIKLNPEFETRLTQNVEVDGVGLRLKQYQVTSLVKGKEISLQEKTFLSTAISDSILAIAVEDHTLRSGDITRVFVVEKKEMKQ